MKFILITNEEAIVEAARKGFHPDDEMASFAVWSEALDASTDCDLMFVDLLSTLDEPHKIAGYERFAMAKMAHSEARGVPLVLISPPVDYELDFMTGWPDFLVGNIPRPVNEKIFRRASTWV